MPDSPSEPRHCWRTEEIDRYGLLDVMSRAALRSGKPLPPVAPRTPVDAVRDVHGALVEAHRLMSSPHRNEMPVLDRTLPRPAVPPTEPHVYRGRAARPSLMRRAVRAVWRPVLRAMGAR